MRWNMCKPSAPDTSSPKRTILIWGGMKRPHPYVQPNPPCSCLATITGSTAVGHHAIQLATLSGYRVIATASAVNHPRLRELGADECFDYKQTNVVADIKAAAGEQGIFAAYDTACSNGSTDMCIGKISSCERSFESLANHISRFTDDRCHRATRRQSHGHPATSACLGESSQRCSSGIRSGVHVNGLSCEYNDHSWCLTAGTDHVSIHKYVRCLCAPAQVRERL